MGTFGIVGFSFGISGLIFGIIAMGNAAKNTKDLEELRTELEESGIIKPQD